MNQQDYFSPPPVVTPEDAAKILRPRLQITRPDDHKRIIGTATFVGVPYQTGKGLFWRDLLWGEFAFEACASLGLHVDRDIRITAVDLNNGHDFHDPRVASIPADLLVGCLLARPIRHPENACYRESGPLLRMSGKQTGEESWKKSLQLCKPKVALFFSEAGKFEDVSTQDLKTSGYAEAKPHYRIALHLDGIGKFCVIVAPLVRKDIADLLPRHCFLQDSRSSQVSLSSLTPGG